MGFELERWNSFSRVALDATKPQPPQYWGPSPVAPAAPILQACLHIDGEASTTARRFHSPLDLAHLRYDVTNVGWALGRTGPSCVIGLGGGRDIQAAILAGSSRITAIDVNEIFVQLHRGRLQDLTRIADRPDVEMVVDDARAHLARSRDQFDMIQMSLVDTWASTGAGAFSLSENSLYTVEAWTTFLSRLTPRGVLAVEGGIGGTASGTPRNAPLLRVVVADTQVRKQLESLMQDTGLHVNLDALVGGLPVGDQQRLEILKALYRGAKVLILDEPTAVLTPQETSHLFKVLAHLRSQGTTILLITHKLKEVMGLCDCVTVMRAGRVVQEMPISQASIEGLAEAMVGRKVQMGRVQEVEKPVGDVLLSLRKVQVRDAQNVVRLADIDLDLRAGEIVGVAGVSGNGQSELLDVLSGLLKPTEGEMHLGGRSFAQAAWLDPRTARTLGLAHVPEDRHARAMVMAFSAWESAVLGYDGLPAYTQLGWMNHASMRSATAQMMERFDVRPRDPELGSSKFSGGNQQKLVLARELGQAPKVLLVGQPTRGVDIGAIEFIYSQLRAMRDAGCAVLVVSSELDEILALSNRVIVMNQGRVTGELAIEECSEANLGLLMTGGAR